MKTRESQLNTLIDLLDVIDKDIFPDVYNLYQILVAIPQTSCKVERMFSSVKRIKTRLRSQMTTVRLNNLTLLSIEKDITDTLRPFSTSTVPYRNVAYSFVL